MNISEIIFFIGLAIVISFIAISILKTQSLISIYTKEGILKQPYSFDILKKQQILILALLDAPIILSAILISYINNLLKYKFEYSYVIFIAYFISLTIVCVLTTYSFNIATKNFLYSISAHPQKGNILSSRLIFSFSILQAPLIISIVAIFININLIKNLLNIYPVALNLNKIILFSSSIISTSISAAGSILGIKKLTESFAKLNIYFLSIAEKNFLNFIFSIGLIDAPFIFSFLVNLLIGNATKNINNNFEIILMSILILFFGIICFTVSLNSGKVASISMNSLSQDFKKNKNIFSICILSQIFLDARVLYMFIIVIIFLSKLSLF